VGLLKLRRLQSRFKADVVHVHWADHRAVACAAASLRPLVLSVKGSDVNRLLQPGADETKRRDVGDALAAAGLIFVDSPDMPQKCAQMAGCAVRPAILPLGIDTNLFRPASSEVARACRQRLDVPDDAILFMSSRAWGALY
jgi:glycosyltransferase involved in cell wall biosynthesis